MLNVLDPLFYVLAAYQCPYIVAISNMRRLRYALHQNGPPILLGTIQKSAYGWVYGRMPLKGDLLRHFGISSVGPSSNEFV